MKRHLFKLFDKKALIATKKTNPSLEEWEELGQPLVLIKVKEVPEERIILYEEVGFGAVILKKATRFYYGTDKVQVGKWVGLGPYYTGKNAKLYKQI